MPYKFGIIETQYRNIATGKKRKPNAQQRFQEMAKNVVYSCISFARNTILAES